MNQQTENHNQYVQHIRTQSGELKGTLAAVIINNKVSFGYSIVNPKDSPMKKIGSKIALGRASKGKVKSIPAQIYSEASGFMETLGRLTRFQNKQLPSIKDFTIEERFPNR